jgi:NIMA (never in mitosis gene a)-related kinase
MMKQVLSGLSVLHERNIIHRDIKSANIFISNSIFKIADLNVSKLLKKDLAYTQTGTPYYASP